MQTNVEHHDVGFLKSVPEYNVAAVYNLPLCPDVADSRLSVKVFQAVLIQICRWNFKAYFINAQAQRRFQCLRGLVLLANLRICERESAGPAGSVPPKDLMAIAR